MKNCIILIAAMMTLPLAVHTQSIRGDGDIVKQEIQLEPLTGVTLGFCGDIILTQGSTQKIVMEGQQNILDNIERNVKNGIWKVNFHKNVHNAKSVKIYITLPTLTEASLSGSGNISTTNTFDNLDKVNVYLSGSGNINLQVNAQHVETAISGSGDITLSGTDNSLGISISGSGEVHAKDLQTADCDVRISGSGDAYVYCTEDLHSAISGSGDVHYRGGTPKVHASVSGSGDIRPMD